MRDMADCRVFRQKKSPRQASGLEPPLEVEETTGRSFVEGSIKNILASIVALQQQIEEPLKSPIRLFDADCDVIFR